MNAIRLRGISCALFLFAGLLSSCGSAEGPVRIGVSFGVEATDGRLYEDDWQRH